MSDTTAASRVPVQQAEGARRPAPADHVVFVHTNDPDGNQVIAYERGDDGSLVRLAAYATGGRGGRQQGAPSDPLASQHSLVYDRAAGHLYAVNAASNTVSVFAVDGPRLRLVQQVPSGGDFPASVATAGDLVYVLNTGAGANVSGYRLSPDGLRPIPDSTRPLGLGTSTPPFFLASPGQIGFTPDARHLVVTTKNHDEIHVFAVTPDGTPSRGPVVSASSGPVPFSFVFDAAGRLVVAEASGALSSYEVASDGSLRVVAASVPNGQQATCWLAAAKGFLYAVNAVSGTVSGYAIEPGGELRLLDSGGVTATVGGGAIDLAASIDGEFLYVENGAAATLHGFRVGADGSLAALPPVAGLPRFGAPQGYSVEGLVAL